MSRRIPAFVALLVTFALVAPARAQIVDPPPPADEAGELDNWTFMVMKALFLAALVMVVAVAVGYVVKSREFRANQRRGGSK